MLERQPKPPISLRKDVVMTPVRGRKDLREILHGQAELPRTRETVDSVLNAVSGATGRELPVDLAFQLGWDNYIWQMVYHMNALTAVYVGTDEGSGNTPIDLQQAKGIVTVDSRANDDELLHPVQVGFAGIATDTTGTPRVLRVEYDVASGKARTVKVSISPQERPMAEAMSHPDDQHLSDRHLSPIPSDLRDWGISGTPVTEAMVSEAAGHKKMLGGVKVVHSSDQHFYLDDPVYQRRFFIEDDATWGTIGRHNGKYGDRRELEWQVAFPTELSHT